MNKMNYCDLNKLCEVRLTKTSEKNGGVYLCQPFLVVMRIIYHT